MTDNGGAITITWTGATMGALWTTSCAVVLLDLILWTGTAVGHAGTLLGLVALAYTVLCGQRRCQEKMQAAMLRQQARQEVIEQLGGTIPAPRNGPRKLV